MRSSDLFLVVYVIKARRSFLFDTAIFVCIVSLFRRKIKWDIGKIVMAYVGWTLLSPILIIIALLLCGV